MKMPDWRSFMKGFIFSIIIGLCICSRASALEIAGVSLPETASMSSGEKVVLNGGGIRSKFFVKVYVGALYLREKNSSAQTIIEMQGPKRVAMHFLHSEVSRDKITDAWIKSFSENSSPKEMEALQPDLNRFNAMFRTMQKGDVIRLDYLSSEGTQVWINDALQGTIKGEHFYRALLKVWIGSSPADRSLKDGMLGISR